MRLCETALSGCVLEVLEWMVRVECGDAGDVRKVLVVPFVRSWCSVI